MRPEAFKLFCELTQLDCLKEVAVAILHVVVFG